jgi:hypothetical protein
MIDVYDKIKPLLVFETDDDFYYLQLIQRKKENDALGSNSRIIKNYYISSIDYLDEKYGEIKALCDYFNARAMLRLNKRSYRKVAFKAMQNMANLMANGEFSFITKSYDRACGVGHNDKNNTWVIDIDGEFFEIFEKEAIVQCINNCAPIGDKIVIELPTKNGFHLITKPFDLRDFRIRYPEIDIHKDNPVNLYIPS